MCSPMHISAKGVLMKFLFLLAFSAITTNATNLNSLTYRLCEQISNDEVAGHVSSADCMKTAYLKVQGGRDGDRWYGEVIFFDPDPIQRASYTCFFRVENDVMRYYRCEKQVARGE